MSALLLNIPLSSNMTLRSNTIRKSPFLSNYLNCSCKANSSISRFRLAGTQKYPISATDDETNQSETQAAEVVIPKHVAVIMDGNRRWAKSRGLPPLDGYIAGLKALEQLVFNCLKSGVKVLTVFAFSTENWARPKGELDFLDDLLAGFVAFVTEKFVQKEVRLSFIGRREKLSEPMQELMSVVEESTMGYKRMHIVLATDYSGQYDITEATKKVATEVKDGVLQVEDICDAVFERHLGTNVIDDFPNPDLLIRSSGELRLSNFMLWQLAYTEMFFTKNLFPDFDETDFMEAIAAFQRRHRRFGGEIY